MSGQASMYMFESPLRAVPATPVITYRLPQQRSSEEATVPSFSGDQAQPSTPLTHGISMYINVTSMFIYVLCIMVK